MSKKRTSKENDIVYKERKRWLFLGLPFTFTVYTIEDDKLSIREGFLNQKIDDCYLYKIQDTTLHRSLFERLFGLGTIICHTGDVTHPVIKLEHIKRSNEIMEYLFEASEQARIKRRTINMLDIGVNDIDVTD